MANFILGGIIGFSLAIALFVDAMDGWTRDECRSANPGYECTISWAKGDAF